MITHEPTFYDHFDKLDVLEAEHRSVTAAKRAFIREHHMVVVRMHDHWHRRHPEPMATDLARVLGRRKALIILGHVPSEQDGMAEFAQWLGTFVKEMPVTFVPAADPFWAPK